MNEKEIREEFVKLFGEEKLKEEDLIQKLQEFANYICEEWLGLPSVPVVFDDLAKTSEASFNIELGVVLLNKKNKDHILKLLKSTLHELEHYYQLYYVTHFDTPKAKRWIKELQNYEANDLLGHHLQEIELDAMAFAFLVLLVEFGISYQHPIDLIQELIETYIDSKRMIDDN